MTLRSGYRGVGWSKRDKKWRASYKLDGKHIHLGMFEDIHDAGCAVSDFRLELGPALKVLQRRGNIGRSNGVRAYKAKLSAEEKRAIALKGHANRKTLLKTNKSGVTGIAWNSKRQRWVAYVHADGKKMRLGTYKEVEEARAMVEAFYATGKDPR